MRVISAWDQLQRDRFRAAMAAHGHTQSRCASRLVELGAPSADQGAVSRWMTGATAKPRLQAQSAIQQYVDELGLESGLQEPLDPRGDASEDGFLEAVRGLTEEPLLGPRQAAFVDAQITRLSAGPPMSDADDAARRSLSEILGLSGRPGI